MKISRKISVVLLAVVMLAVIIPGVWRDAVPSTYAEAYSSLKNGSLSENVTVTYPDGTSKSRPAYWEASQTGMQWVNNTWSNRNMWEFDGTATDGTVLLSQVVKVDCNATYELKFWNYHRSSDSCDKPNFRYRVELGKTEETIDYTVLSGTPTKITYASGKGDTYTFESGTYKYVRISFLAGSGYKACLYDVSLSAKKSGDTNTHATPTLKHTHEGKSRTESYYDPDGILHYDSNGLAFKFELVSSGLSVNTTAQYYSQGRYDIDYTNGLLKPFGNSSTYTFVTTGALVTNDSEVGVNPNAFTRNRVNGNSLIDVPAQKAWEIPGSQLEFVVRVINIPDSHLDTVIYCRPYYVFVDSSGEEITVYSDIQYDSFNGLPVE